jgi:hypothetical protein
MELNGDRPLAIMMNDNLGSNLRDPLGCLVNYT